MAVRKTPTVKLVLSLHEQTCFKNFFLLLIAIEKETGRRKTTAKKTKKAKSNSDINGSLIRGPIFLFEILLSICSPGEACQAGWRG